jgi:hypothetical protein
VLGVVGLPPSNMQPTIQRVPYQNTPYDNNPPPTHMHGCPRPRRPPAAPPPHCGSEAVA